MLLIKHVDRPIKVVATDWRVFIDAVFQADVGVYNAIHIAFKVCEMWD